jgi:hypothetical protein
MKRKPPRLPSLTPNRSERVDHHAEPDSIQFLAGDEGDVVVVFDYIRIPDDKKHVRLTWTIPANQVDEFAETLRSKGRESLERKRPN